MRKFNVTGMSCAACQARVEKAVSNLDGIDSCSVSLLTNEMAVEGKATDDEILKAVEKAGYGASPKGKKTEARNEDDGLKDTETPRLKKRLLSSLGFLLVLMYFSMGHMMLGFPVPSFFHGNPVGVGLVQMLLALIVMTINRKFFISGGKGLLHKAPNMDTLVAMGSGASFVWSLYVLFAMTRAQVDGDLLKLESLSMEFYFESAAMILTLITVGKMLEARSKGKTTDALKSLMKLQAKTCTVIRDNIEKNVPIEEVRKGDVFAVKPGEAVPVDGRILEGESALDESALSGESLPVDKKVGDQVYSASINQSGYLRCMAEKVGEDTTLSQIIRLVSDAAATKAPSQKIADKVSGVFVPTVMGIAILTTIVWTVAKGDFGFALARGISVLVISCPCALGLATPVAIMVGNGVGARNGILFKTAEALEETGKVDVVALDKTGTITEGKPRVVSVHAEEAEEEFLHLAASLEKLSEHPLSKAILEYGSEKGIALSPVEDFKSYPGNGLSGVVEGRRIYGGKRSFIEGFVSIPKKYLDLEDEVTGKGATPLFFAEEGRFLGLVATADTIRLDSRKAIEELKGMGIKVVMITGDNERTAQTIGREAGVDQVIAGVLPEGKEKAVRKLMEEGSVMMVGDGINDAPALTAAHIGVAIGQGTDIAIDSSDVVLVKNSLCDASGAIRLSRATYRNIKENLFWAFFYNMIGIPLAAGLWIPIFGWTLNPMFGALAMSLSSFCVVSNALRLNLVKVHDTKHDKFKKHKEMKEKEVIPMVKTMKIEGMMCGHCEARVKKTLEAVEGVESAVVSHTEGTAVVTLSGNVDDSVLKAAVEAQDYPVTAIN